MGKFESTMNTRLKLFYTVFVTIFSFLHYWIIFVFTDGFTLNSVYNSVVFLVCSIGFILIPVGHRISEKVPRSKWYFLAWTGYIWMGILFISLSLCTLYFVAKSFWPEIPLNGYQILGFVMAVSCWALYQGVKDPVVRRQVVDNKKGIQNLKIVQITDMHVGLLGHDLAWVERIVEKINLLDADFVVLTGDLEIGRAHV